MRTMEAKKYNLRSGRREEHVIPIQLQVASDEDFISQTLGSSHPAPGQVFLSDQSQSTSESDLDISGILQDSDQNLSTSDREVHFKRKKSGNGRLAEQSDPNSGQISQNAINQQILAQLQSLGSRLDSLEQKPVKKTADKSKIKTSKKIGQPTLTGSGSARKSTVRDGTASDCIFPSPSDLRQDAKIQQEVQLRLQELADNAGKGNEKIKSQRGGAVDVYVGKRIRWPHEYVLAGSTKELVSCNQLTPIQWMAGFCRSMREEINEKNREFMLDYLVNLLEDTTDFSWAAAKASHAVLLCRMEQGEVKDWSEVKKIDRIRRAHAQRHVTANVGSNPKNQDRAQFAPAKFTPCIYYNRNACSQTKTHETKGVLYRHICSACWTSDNKAYGHSQADCRRTRSKNE